MNVKKGQRYRAKCDVLVTCMTSWAAPYTGGYKRTFPKGQTLVIANDPPPEATAVYADPINYRSLHSAMVPMRDRLQFWVYRGYYLCITLPQLETEFESA
jgi:hypothetical protein